MFKFENQPNVVRVNLNNIDKVKEFVFKTSSISESMDLVSGRHEIDAKSIMGVYSLYLARDIYMVIHAEGNRVDEIKEILKDFIV